MRHYLDSLDGKSVVGVDVSADEAALRFRLADGTTVVWGTDGDCCSESWWADGLELNSLRGGTVLAASEIEMPDPNDDRSRQEVDQIFGVRITTNRGVTTFVFRNSSNGYYGGHAFLGSDRDSWDWREITGGTWSA